MLVELGVQISTSPIPAPLPLCKGHYHQLYKTIWPEQRQCITCGASLRRSNPKLCPKPSEIQKHLHEHSGYNGEIKEGDKVCYTCYRAHLSILQEQKNVSKDNELKELILNLHQTSEIISKAMNSVTEFVAQQLLVENALLLPDITDKFYAEAANLTGQEQPEIKKSVTPTFVLSNLVSTLQHHLAYSCTVRKYGTLLYRPGSDLTKPLTQALWKLRQHKNASTLSPPTNEDRHRVLRDFNDRARQHINYFLKNNDKHTFQMADNTLQEYVCG